MKKKILFLVHSNNDVDWFLPLIAALAGRPDVEPVALFLRSEEQVLTSPACRRVLEEARVRRIYFDDIFGGSFLRKRLLDIQRSLVRRTGLGSLGEFVRERRFLKAALKGTYAVMERMFGEYPEVFFPHKMIEKFLDGLRPAMLVLDIQRIRKNRPYFRDKRSYATSRITIYCKKKALPVFMVPHGMSAVLDAGEKEGCGVFEQDKLPDYGDSELIPPDVYAIGFNETELRHAEIVDGNTEIKVLGSIRYDDEWERFMQGLSLECRGRDMEKASFTALYVVRPLEGVPDEKLRRDIFQIAGSFPGIELWIKPFPGSSGGVRADEREESGNIREFGEGTDTGELIFYSDLVISPDPSIVIQAVINNKPAILYRPGAKRLAEGGVSGGELSAVLLASDPGQLLEHCRKVMDGRVTPGRRDGGESIVSRYVEVVERLSKEA